MTAHHKIGFELDALKRLQAEKVEETLESGGLKFSQLASEGEGWYPLGK